MEEKALSTMGENKASYLTKSYVEKIPASDQKDVHELKTGVGNAAGGALQNPLGGFVRKSSASETFTNQLTFCVFRLATRLMILPSLLLAADVFLHTCIALYSDRSFYDINLAEDSFLTYVGVIARSRRSPASIQDDQFSY
jgi:hypothetical protein